MSNEDTSWNKRQLSRRDFNRGLAAMTAAVAAVGGSAACKRKSDNEGERESELEANELQQETSWNFGSESSELRQQDTADGDVGGMNTWGMYTSTLALTGLMSPSNSAHADLDSLTLVEVLRDSEVRANVQPVHTDAMEEAYQRGVAVARIVANMEASDKTMVVVDAPGAESVAISAGLSGVMDPVYYFDNWPHPEGLVDSQQTLGSLLYYSRELSDQKQARSDDAPPAFILDSDRLSGSGSRDASDSGTFDNRYIVDLPTVAQLKSMGIEQVLYVTPELQAEESDDLNDAFADYAEGDIIVNNVPLSEFQELKDDEALEGAGKTLEPEEQGYHSHRRYYYGGFPWIFWYSYPRYRPYGGYGYRTAPSRYSNTVRNVRRNNYAPARRTTAFSSRTVGGSTGSGVGRRRPTGFGRVTTRFDRSGRPTGWRSGSRSFSASRTYSSSRLSRSAGVRRSTTGGSTGTRRTGTFGRSSGGFGGG